MSNLALFEEVSKDLNTMNQTIEKTLLELESIRLKSCIDLILSRGLNYYTPTDNTSFTGLIETMLEMNFDNIPEKKKEEDLYRLLEIVRYVNGYTDAQTTSHMWEVVRKFYNHLHEIKVNDYKELTEFMETK